MIELLEDNNIQWSLEGMWHLVICDELRIVRGSLVGHRHMRRRMNHSSRVLNQSKRSTENRPGLDSIIRLSKGKS